MPTFEPIVRNEDALTGGNEYFLIGKYSVIKPLCSVDASGYCTITNDASAEFVKVEPRQESFGTTENQVTNAETGSVSIEQVIDFILAHRTLVKRNQVALYGKNEVIIVAVDALGQGRVYGFPNGLKMDTTAVSSGKKFGGELNGYTFNFKGQSKILAPYVTAEVLADILPA